VSKRVDEVLRYLGAGVAEAPEASSGQQAALHALRKSAEQWLSQLDAQLIPKRLYRLFTLQHQPDGSIALLDHTHQPVLTLTGTLAASLLRDCHQAALLLATLGTPFDAMLRTQQTRDMAQAAILDACGNVLVEEACDLLEQEIHQQVPGLYLTDRFSPGYGDLPLSLQPEILRALDATRQAGVYLTDSLLMNPSKTVTAIVGLSHRPQGAKIRGCACCSLRNTCTIRKDGKRCDSL